MPVVGTGGSMIRDQKIILKAGLHATICRPDLSARQCRSANRTCILTPDLRPIRENENRPDSENLLQCNRFLCSRADTFKEADMSIKILSREHAYKSEAIKMADKKTPKIMLQQVTAMTLLLLLMMNKAPINCDSQPFFS